MPILMMEHYQRQRKTIEVDWRPRSEPQQLALESEADVLLFGGQAGGGKTDILLGSAVLGHQRSVIFRREYTQLTGLEDRSYEIYDRLGKFNGHRHRWTLPSKIIQFGAMKSQDDWRKWRGIPFDLMAFDEAAEFHREQVQNLMAWNRSVNPNQRCRVILASNPPSSAEGEWITQMFAPWLDEGHPEFPVPFGELRWFVTIDDRDEIVDSAEPIEYQGRTTYPQSRTFIPASLDDNVFLRDNLGYRAMLDALPEPLRSQLRDGDFTAGREDDSWQVIPTDWVKLAQGRWRDRNRPNIPLSAIGVDVARGGLAKTVLSPRYGDYFDKLIKRKGKETPDGDSIVRLVDGIHSEDAPIQIDPIGVGSSPYDLMIRHGLPVAGINFGHKSRMTDRSGKYKMANKRAEGFWSFREALDPEFDSGIALPPDSELLADLCAPRYKVTSSGIQIEDKREVEKRLGRSVDSGDAVVLAFMATDIGESLPLLGGEYESVRGHL